MTTAAAAPAVTLADALFPATRGTLMARNVLLALIGSALLYISARTQVQLGPVPLTMQPFAVLLIGLAYGSRLGAATVALYLAEGAAGLPVFANGGGLAYFAGPTGGFLVGFLAAAYVTGWLSERNGWSRNPATVFVAALAGVATIYVVGLPWLTAVLVLATGKTVPAAAGYAVTGVFAKFIVGDLIKAALAALLVPGAWKLLGRARR